MDEVVLREGMLASGRQWALVESRRSAVTTGKHFIIAPVDNAPGTAEEDAELITIALRLAPEVAPEPGRWRVGFNGPKQRTRQSSHVHIICPAGGDELPRLTDRMTKVAAQADSSPPAATEP